jgi:nicotinate-nucleotide adenylyltransferase
MKRIAFYGGSFDPLHCGHLTIARALIERFRLDKFVFIPAFHAPHKLKTSDFGASPLRDARRGDERGSRHQNFQMEIDAPERPFTLKL